jgi:hypothetical protein
VGWSLGDVDDWLVEVDILLAQDSGHHRPAHTGPTASFSGTGVSKRLIQAGWMLSQWFTGADHNFLKI